MALGTAPHILLPWGGCAGGCSCGSSPAPTTGTARGALGTRRAAQPPAAAAGAGSDRFSCTTPVLVVPDKLPLPPAGCWCRVGWVHGAGPVAAYLLPRLCRASRDLRPLPMPPERAVHHPHAALGPLQAPLGLASSPAEPSDPHAAPASAPQPD